MTSTIYLASSWRNIDQQDSVFRLRAGGHYVYDFRNPLDSWDTSNPSDGSEGFTWASIDPQWQQWSPWSFRQALATREAGEGFSRDWKAMKRADTCVLLLPCGRSAHLEAGYFAGHPDKRLFIVAPAIDEPELMYLMADGIYLSIDELIGSGDL